METADETTEGDVDSILAADISPSGISSSPELTYTIYSDVDICSPWLKAAQIPNLSVRKECIAGKCRVSSSNLLSSKLWHECTTIISSIYPLVPQKDLRVKLISSESIPITMADKDISLITFKPQYNASVILACDFPLCGLVGYRPFQIKLSH